MRAHQNREWMLAGRRLTIGLSSAYLRQAQQDTAQFDLEGLGIDAFFSNGPLTAQAEYAFYDSDPPEGPQDDEGSGFYAQAGYLVSPRVELTTRHQQFDPSSNTSGDRVRWTSVGVNIYIRGHNLKVQSDFTVRSEQDPQSFNNLFQVQLQIDF